MGAAASVTCPDRLDEAACKALVGETNFNQDKFDEKKDADGFVSKIHVQEALLANLWMYSPLHTRNADVAAVWDFMIQNWKQVPGISMPVIEQFRGMVGILDQTPAEFLEQVTAEEILINGSKGYMYTPKVLENAESRKVVLYFHGGGFIMSGPEHWPKECAKHAVLSHAIVICPYIGVGPEVKASPWLENAYCSLKWVHDEATRLKIDSSNVCVYGSSHGAFTALVLSKHLAEKDESGLVKFCWLDIPAINNDFVEHFQTPENEPEPMHQACSKLHLQCWATLFTDVENLETFDWNDHKDNAEAFPAVMGDDLLAKIPPCILTSGEFDHVGLRGSQLFADRLKGIDGKLLGLYIQPGVGHALYGAAQEDRDVAFKLIYSTFL